MNRTKAALITIGDELLIGQTIDTNSAWIARQLNDMGIEVLRRVAVGDTKEAIITCLNEESQRATLIIITGGLGPTSDDITKPLLCEYFGGKLVVDERVTAHLYDIFARRKRPMLERNLKQAEVPDVCIVLFNAMGTAPGMWFEKEGRIYVSLPGVPFEMKHIMQEEVLPRLARLISGNNIVHKSILTAGEGESYIAEKLLEIESALPHHIKLAYLPDSGFVKLRLTGQGADAAGLTEEVSKFQKAIIDILGGIVIADEDVPLEALLGKTADRLKATIGVAESCTGGLIGHMITNVPGASIYFKGGIVSYANEIKEQVLGVPVSTIENNGAVSEETVAKMAEGALKTLQVDYAISVSGVLGPSGGTDRVKVGTVWMAVAGKDRTVSKMHQFYYDRDRNKEMAAKSALLLLWKFMNNLL